MNELDQKILLQLIKHGEQTIMETAGKVGASRQTVAKKIGQLKADGTITSFTAKLNPEKFDLATKAYVLIREESRTETRRKNEMTIKRFPEVTEFYRLFGRYSTVLEILVKNDKELSKLVKRIHRLKGVRETETLIVHSTVKNEPESPFVRLLSSAQK